MIYKLSVVPHQRVAPGHSSLPLQVQLSLPHPLLCVHQSLDEKNI